MNVRLRRRAIGELEDRLQEEDSEGRAGSQESTQDGELRSIEEKQVTTLRRRAVGSDATSADDTS
jgi:hypothetical protein